MQQERRLEFLEEHLDFPSRPVEFAHRACLTFRVVRQEGHLPPLTVDLDGCAGVEMDKVVTASVVVDVADFNLLLICWR